MDIHPQDKDFGRRILYGAALWVLFCIVAVLLRGIRWDETFEHAQILAGKVPYPEGHPLRMYVHNAFSVQPYLSAVLLLCGGGPALVCGMRNILFLLATVLPVYFMTALFTGRTRWGHAAAALLLQGILLEFDGSYPTVVWPELYSNGPIGGAWALLTLWALLANHLRIAGLLFGLMPCIHLGQWPPVLVLFLLFGLYEAGRTNRGTVRAVAIYSAIGVFVSILFFLAQRLFFHEPLPASAGNDLMAVWRGYTFHFDPHRRFPPGNGQILLCGTLLLSGLAAWRTPDSRRLYLGLFLYAAAIASCVWGIMIVHFFLGENTPFLLLSWMPYRLINHLPPVCLALIISVLVPRQGVWVLAALLFGILHPWLRPLLGDSLYTRYLSGGECVVYCLYGAALWTLLVPLVPKLHMGTHLHKSSALNASPPPTHSNPQFPNLPACAVLVVLCLALSFFHQFGAGCLVLGVLGVVFANRIPKLHALPATALAAAILLALLAAIYGQARFHQKLPVSMFAREIRTTLQDEPGALLAGPPDTLLLQAHTGHPVLAETATPSLISYVPAIGPAINQLYEDLYGISFLNPTASSVSWDQLWRERSLQEWQMLSKRYGFHYVISLPSAEVQLPLMFADSSAVLYKIPDFAGSR